MTLRRRKFIDLKLDTKKSDHEVKSLVNKTVVLTCAFERERVIATHYEWMAFGGTKDLTNKRSLSYGGNKTSYTFIPISARDFGQYECTIRTDNTKIQHEIILKQLRKLSGAYLRQRKWVFALLLDENL